MELKELKKRPGLGRDSRSGKKYLQFEKLINELKQKELNDKVINSLNESIDHINSFRDTDPELAKQLRKTQSKILMFVAKELKLVVKNHYRNQWMALGMATFGIPIGMAFGVSLSNMGLLGIGLPMGMMIGILVGSAMDKKAQDNGKQLDLVIRH
ncbi:hypothetical protein GWK08_15510 [Leptobacterium flavescens]|uniref:Uncharacterized protein n=1 Tax=Leptobacterium flavescens TaxID=472055 RepID=A0A6P0UVN8_9FLAO|nr:hypothetical protein [Leptobacterium flavescens]NER14863.1 hypothetical protein [Leptobacterium flavescens]